MIAADTHTVAVQTDNIAKLVVADANEKEFIGKDGVQAKDTSINKTSTSEPVKTKRETEPKKETPKTTITPVTSNSSDDEWASF